MLTVLYQDDRIIVVHKPPRILVHRTRISEDTDFVLQRLRKQIGQRVYPAHRLDRPTAGVLVFGLDSEMANGLMEVFSQRKAQKVYLSVVRGYLPESGHIDYPLAKEGKPVKQEAVTDFTRLATAEVPISAGRYPNSRYSLVEVQPKTGRFHQIRRHFSHLRHPIIGDKKHGDVKHNKLFRDHMDTTMLMLLAWKISFPHPATGKVLHLKTQPEPDMVHIMQHLGWGDWIERLFGEEEKNDNQPL